MEKIKSIDELRETILMLETKQEAQRQLLKQEFHDTYENLKPWNLIKNSFKEASESQDLKDSALGTAVGVTSGLLSKAIVVGVSHNPIKKLVGSLVQYGISNLVSKHPETIKSIAGGIASFFRKKKETKKEYNIHLS